MSFSCAKENIFHGLNQCISYPCKKGIIVKNLSAFSLKLNVKNVNSKINNNSSDKYSLEEL